MRILHRFGFALWLGLVALSASGVAQNQLSLNVITATLSGDGHFMPDGTFMAGPMHGPSQDGHSHKGHADCSVCGVVASMAALSVPVLDAVPLPETFAIPPSTADEHSISAKALYAPYASRAPPHLIG